VLDQKARVVVPEIVEAGPVRCPGSLDGCPPEMPELRAPDRLPALVEEHEVVGRERRTMGREGVDDDLAVGEERAQRIR